jgi:hypothetical protein
MSKTDEMINDEITFNSQSNIYNSQKKIMVNFSSDDERERAIITQNQQTIKLYSESDNEKII